MAADIYSKAGADAAFVHDTSEGRAALMASEEATSTIAGVSNPVARLVVLGDSLSEAQTTGGATDPWAQDLADAFGVPLTKLAVRGRCSSDLAVLAGALDLVFTVPGGGWSAGNKTVTLTTTGAFRNSSGANTVLTGEITTNSGDVVSATLTHVQGGSHYWQITTSVAVSAASFTFHCTAADDYLNAAWLIWVGHNNLLDGQDYDFLVRDVALITQRLLSRGSRYLVVGVTNPANAPRGTADYSKVVDRNTLLAAQYGDRFLDIRTWLIARGLDQAALTATSDDLTDIGNDVIPRQLRIDNSHYTPAGYDAIKEKVQRAFSWLPVFPGAIPTSEPVAPSVSPLWSSGVIVHYPAEIVPDAVGTRAATAPDNGGTHPLSATSSTAGYIWTVNEASGRRFLRSGGQASILQSSAWTPPTLTEFTAVLVAAWDANPSSTQRFIGLGGTSGTVYTIGIKSTGVLTVWTGNSPGLDSSSAPSKNTRHVIVVTVDGTTATIYVDGAVAGSGTVGAIAAPVSGLTNIYGPAGMIVDYWDGGFIDHALTGGEVATLTANLS